MDRPDGRCQVLATQLGYPASTSGANGQKLICNTTDCRLKGVGFGTLVGRIGSSPPFRIGKDHQIIAQSDGALFFPINDTDISDNSGSFFVQASVSEESTGATEARFRCRQAVAIPRL